MTQTTFPFHEILFIVCSLYQPVTKAEIFIDYENFIIFLFQE